MRRIVWVGARSLLGILATLLVVFVMGMRRRSATVIRAARRLSRATKRLPLRTAGRGGSYVSIVRHVGRRSGREYETPVHVARMDDGYVIALPYGSDGDWVRNVLASGRAVIRFDGREHRVDGPHVVDLKEYERYFSTQDRQAHRLFGVGEALVVSDDAGGPLPHTPAPADHLAASQ